MSISRPLVFIKNKIGDSKNNLVRTIIRTVNRRAFKEDYLRNLPQPFHPAAWLVFNGRATKEENGIAKRIEGFRKTLSILNEMDELGSYGSPHSGEFEKTAGGHIKTGEYLPGTIDIHMGIGVKKEGGLLLRRLVEGLKAKSILELGTHTGFSASYFLSLPDVELVTVEGSQDLSKLAEKIMSLTSDKYRLLNMSFDDAIDRLEKEEVRFDCVYIDGQHESEAAQHYLERVIPLLNPSGAVILDDIYWSDGMNQGWRTICNHPNFSRTMDFAMKGIVISESEGSTRFHHDICDYIGRPHIFRKGW